MLTNMKIRRGGGGGGTSLLGLVFVLSFIYKADSAAVTSCATASGFSCRICALKNMPACTTSAVRGGPFCDEVKEWGNQTDSECNGPSPPPTCLEYKKDCHYTCTCCGNHDKTKDVSCTVTNKDKQTVQAGTCQAYCGPCDDKVLPNDCKSGKGQRLIRSPNTCDLNTEYICDTFSSSSDNKGSFRYDCK